MSVDIMVSDYNAGVDAEVKATVSPEIIAQAAKFYQAGLTYEEEEKAWEAHRDHIAPIEAKYSMNMCNSRFLRMMNDILSQNVEWCGSMSGEDLEHLRVAALEALASLSHSPVEFDEVHCASTTREVGEQGAVIISCGDDPEYWRGRLAELVSLIEVSGGEISWS